MMITNPPVSATHLGFIVADTLANTVTSICILSLMFLVAVPASSCLIVSS